jgi:hypothetical protein
MRDARQERRHVVPRRRFGFLQNQFASPIAYSDMFGNRPKAKAAPRLRSASFAGAHQGPPQSKDHSSQGCAEYVVVKSPM